MKTPLEHQLAKEKRDADAQFNVPSVPDTRLEAWKEYEKVAMHFNDLLMRLRTQSLGGVAAVATLASLVAKGDISSALRWGVLTASFGLLLAFWTAIWILDFRYYNRLLTGAVDALLELEKNQTVQVPGLSTRIDEIVAGDAPQFARREGRTAGRHLFYLIVFFALFTGLGISVLGFCGRDVARTRTLRPEIFGNLVDAETKRPIEAAEVRLYRAGHEGFITPKVNSRRDGKFTIAPVTQFDFFPLSSPPSLLMTVMAHHSGYQPAMIEFDHFDFGGMRSTNIGQIELHRATP